MRILVAGGTGHTGERLVRRLLRGGWEVRFLTRRGAAHPVVDGLVRAGAVRCGGDALRRWTLFEALEGCDVLASCAHIRHAGAMIQACRHAGVRRYLQMSSTRRYTQWPCPTSREVIAGERLITSSGLDHTILRPTMIFGGQRDGNVTRLLAWFRRHRWFPLFGEGANLVQPVYVEDLVDAMMEAIRRPEVTAGRDYTLAGPEPLPLREFLLETARAAGVRRPLLPSIPLAPALAAARLLPPSLAARTLSAEQIRRFGEDKDADISRAVEDLAFHPRPYGEAVRAKAAGLAEVEAVYPQD